ncbi:hypothetical protein [Streptomyces sp. YIM S03343]
MPRSRGRTGARASSIDDVLTSALGEEMDPKHMKEVKAALELLGRRLTPHASPRPHG